MARPLLQLRVVKSLREVVAAAAGGVAATLVDVATLVLLVERAAASVPVAATAAALAGGAVGYAVNKRVAFRDRSPVTLQQLARFGLVAVAAALLMGLAMRIVAVELRVPYLAAKVACGALVFFTWTYPAQRRLVFARRAPAGSPAASPVSPAVSPAHSLV